MPWRSLAILWLSAQESGLSVSVRFQQAYTLLSILYSSLLLCWTLCLLFACALLMLGCCFDAFDYAACRSAGFHVSMSPLDLCQLMHVGEGKKMAPHRRDPTKITALTIWLPQSLHPVGCTCPPNNSMNMCLAYTSMPSLVWSQGA